MATGNTTQQEDLSFMEEHFRNAGVEVENTQDESGTEGATDNQTEAGTVSPDQVQGDAGKDNTSGANDKSVKSEQKPEGQSADPAKPGQQQQQQPQLKQGDIQLQDGTVIRAGQERRWYDQMNVARQQRQAALNDLNTTNQKFANLQTKYEALETSMKQLGLAAPEEATAALGLYRDLQRDVVGTLTKLLAEAKAKGYTVDGIGSHVDTRAINDLLDRRLKPSETEQQKANQERIAQEVEQELQAFIRDYPDALIHEAFIAKIVEQEAARGRPISMRDAMFALKEKVIADGFDWSQALAPQIDARQRGQQQQQQQQQQQMPRTPGRLPGGGAASEDLRPSDVIVPENDSSEAIIRAAMKENGLIK